MKFTSKDKKSKYALNAKKKPKYAFIMQKKKYRTCFVHKTFLSLKYSAILVVVKQIYKCSRGYN